MLELPPNLENHLREQAARRGLKIPDYLWQITGSPSELTGNSGRPRESDPAYLLTLPKAERDRILEEQAALAAPLYEADLALPVADRELTAFSSLYDAIQEDYDAD